MFSFISFIRSIGDMLNRNKGWLFTLLFLLAVSGILASMYFVDKIAKDASSEIYEKLRDDMISSFENTLEVKKNNGLTAVSMLSSNLDKNQDGLSTSLMEMSARLDEKLQEVSRISIYDKRGATMARSWESEIATPLKEEQVVMLSESDMISDIDIKKDGVYISSIVAKRDQNGSNIFIEYQQNIATIQSNFSATGKDYIFLLKKSWLNALDASERIHYRQVSDAYLVKTDTYDDLFLLNLNTLNLDKLREQGFNLNDNYFTVIDKVKNFSGDTIGLVIIGEKTESAGSIVQIAQKIVNSITTIAIGLVTSIILLMF